MNAFDEQLAIIEQALRPAAAKLHRAQIVNAAAAGLRHAANTAVPLAFVVAAVVLLFRLVQIPWQMPAIALCSLAIMSAMVLLARPIIAAARSRPSIRDAAERLDRSLDNHNRLATALSLLENRSTSLFARKAVESGLEHLRQIDPLSVPTPAADWSASSVMPRVAAAGLLLAICVALPLPVRVQPSTPTPTELAGVDLRATEPASPQSDAATQRSPQPAASESSTAVSSSPLAGSASTPGRADTAGSLAHASPASAADASATAGNSAARSSSNESADASPARASQAQSTPTDPAAPRQDAESGANASDGDTASGQPSPTAGAGGKSTASKADPVPPVQTPDLPQPAGADQQLAAADPNAPDTPPNSGAQPMRQGRDAPGSRELGQSGSEGERGSGRGGPGESKKSRGAGSVFLSVPLPDFVMGRLNNGVSRVTREWVPPQRSDLPPPVPADISARQSRESVVSRFDVPPNVSDDVSRYLKLLYMPPNTASEGAIDP